MTLAPEEPTTPHGCARPAAELVMLSQYGVSATPAESLVDPKLKNLTADNLVALQQRGVDADTAKQLRGSR